MRSAARQSVLWTALILCACRNSTPTEPTAGGTPPPPPPADAAALDAQLQVCPSALELQGLAPLRVEMDAALTQGERVCRQSDGSVDLTRAQRTIYRALLFLKNTSFDRPLPWTDESAWEWLLRLNPIVAFLARAGVAQCSPCATGNAMLQFPSLRLQTDPPTWTSVATLASGIVHEARHVDVGGHRCGNRDNRADDLHAFGAHYYYLVYVARHSSPADFPVGYRPYLEWSACSMRNSAFCDDRC